MVHLGICYGHNSSIAAIKDGKLIFCQSEERLNRIKNSTGFPRKTLDYIYENICSPSDVISATLFERSIYGYLHLKSHGFEPYQYGDYLSSEIAKPKLIERWLQSEIRWKLQSARIRNREKNRALRIEANAYFCQELQLPDRKVFDIDHHLAHAYSTLLNIQHWDQSLIFTLDGVGDWTSATVCCFENGNLRVLDRTDHKNSFGYYYSAVTALLGMKSGEHEFKVMGLAPYAKRSYYLPILEKLQALIGIDESGRWVSQINPNQLRDTLEGIVRYQRFDNVAGAIQELAETLIRKWIHHWVRHTGICDIALAGGVFMNVKVCQELRGSANIGKMFIVPSAADESTAIGCAVWGARTVQPEVPLQPFKDLYLGMEFSDAATEAAFADTHAAKRFEITRPTNINAAVAQLLARNHIVARCSGRMEFGARALGNRSILANPSSWDNVEAINASIKSRDFWMPFTPSILDEDMPKYIRNCDRIFAPYMCITFDTTEDAQSHLKAAIHPRDRTARPQCVIKDWNPDYYEIISEFKRLTGIGAVLNTSFNLHGEPNVCSPYDAIRTVDNSNLNYLAIGSYLLRKTDRQPE